MLSEQHGVYNVNVRCFIYPVHQGLFYQLMLTGMGVQLRLAIMIATDLSCRLACWATLTAERQAWVRASHIHVSAVAACCCLCLQSALYE